MPTFLLAAMLFPVSGYAGGLGLVTTGGLHQERVYYYDAEENQFEVNQFRPNAGTGIEAILGDVDDRIIGVARGFWLLDAPPVAPSDPDVPDATFAIPSSAEHQGVFTVGVQWGVYGDPVGLLVHIDGNIGGGILTRDNLEYVLAEAGGGAQYQFGEHVQVFGEALAMLRYRKNPYPGMNVYAGVRYIFD